MKYLRRFGKFIAGLYATYADFIHAIFPDEAGDFAEYIIDIVLAIIIVKLISSVAFRTKSNG